MDRIKRRLHAYHMQSPSQVTTPSDLPSHPPKRASYTSLLCEPCNTSNPNHHAMQPMLNVPQPFARRYNPVVLLACLLPLACYLVGFIFLSPARTHTKFHIHLDTYPSWGLALAIFTGRRDTIFSCGRRSTKSMCSVLWMNNPPHKWLFICRHKECSLLGWMAGKRHSYT
jgi:hypothetical protein